MNPIPKARLIAAILSLSACAYAADPAPTPAASPTPEPALRELGATPGGPTPTPTAEERRYYRHDGDDDEHRVSVGDAVYVGPDERIPGNAVAVFGSVKVDGVVDGNVVAVFGPATVNGTVHGNAVVVFGPLRIGPHARIDGNVVGAPGVVIREPGSSVGGHIVRQFGNEMEFSDDSGAAAWFHHGLGRGRLLAFGPKLLGVWLISLCMIALYVLLALVFPNGIRRCGTMLAERPGLTVLTGILAVIALPVVFILLCVTVVGIPIALVVLPLLVVASVTFGKAAVYALVGRPILGGSGHPALAVVVGCLIMLVFLLVPFLGVALWVLVAFLGYSCAVAALFPDKKLAPSTPPASAAPAAAALAVPAAAAGVPPQPVAAPQADAAPQAEPLPAAPVLQAAPPLIHASEAALPRAGFWIRMVAFLIDIILIGIVTSMHDMFPIALAVYGALMWRFRGATIGDIIFGLKVVRTDGAPIDWVTAVVRALACFFSAVVVGLGFIWIAFDREKQGWHDKIAGTLVVRHPRGVTLV